MGSKARRPDEERILRGLKDFQRETVEYVFRRLYLDRDCARRFLIADEVGLGKTLVARGVIAKAVNYLWRSVKRIDIVYICSNYDIAQQNINRLNITGEKDFALASRITLLPLKLSNLRGKKLNFVSFTPGTSFELKSNLGWGWERALLYRLLRRAWRLDPRGARHLLQGGMERTNFCGLIEDCEGLTIDEGLADDFSRSLRELSEGQESLKSRFFRLSRLFQRNRDTIPPEQERLRSQLIGELRGLLAQTCLKALQPDVIILDEFQRFKHLLDGDDEAAQLARSLFNYCEKRGADRRGARVILLSATPYKMYTLNGETDSDDHYRDFIRTLQFLQPDRVGEFERLLGEYRQAIYDLGAGGASPRSSARGDLARIKRSLESELRRVMVRTERLAVRDDREGMLSEVPCARATLEADDVVSYAGLAKIGRALGQGSMVEYWKSAPYLLNFMDDYQLKRRFSRAIRQSSRRRPIASALLAGRDVLTLAWRDIASYQKVDPVNSRLRYLAADTVESGAWRLLWIPPSFPYYRPRGVFADPELCRFTKRLVFSSWKVVPRVIAMLLSYEAERRMMRLLDGTARNNPVARRRRRPLLRFARSQGRLSGMATLGLLYPCATLAEECDPLAFRTENSRSPLPIETVLRRLRRRIGRLLRSIAVSIDRQQSPDEWYWAAPILLDLVWRPASTRRWFEREDLAEIWYRAEEDEDRLGDRRETRSKGERWGEHVEAARRLVSRYSERRLTLGPPPRDLIDVLAKMALAGFGVVSLRGLSRVIGDQEGEACLTARDGAAQIAQAFLPLFNLPESMALIRGLDRREPYWERALEYCVDGGLQAVMDEYIHVLSESLGLTDKTDEIVRQELVKTIRGALTLRTSSLAVDQIVVHPRSGTISVRDREMRGRFAARFDQEGTEGGWEVSRPQQVRNAFNSPFWPFVLATTSIGQEGLDFHQYCHTVVHWNLPSNPVDLEQREGRVHRYKGHAVRKNVALNQYRRKWGRKMRDPWQYLFAASRSGRRGKAGDLSPFWVYPVKGGARIERHVPSLPLSREVGRLAALRRSLALYRMVFGQNRQEDLVNYLLARLPRPQALKLADEFRVDLSPPGR